MTPSPPSWIDALDARISGFMARVGPALLRLGLGIVFIWFGLLKSLGVSPAADLVARTVYWGVDPSWFVPALGWWEVAIGVCLLDPGRWLGLGRWMTRAGILLLLLQMPGTFLPLVLVRDATWQQALVPTMEGQYIVKNMVLIGAALYLGGQVRKDEREDAAEEAAEGGGGGAPIRRPIEGAVNSEVPR